MLTQKNPLPPVGPPPEQGPPFPRPDPEPGVLDLIQRLRDDLITWMTLEGELARTELTEKCQTALRGFLLGATGLVLFLCGGIAVLLAVGFGVSGALARAGVDPAFSHSLGFLFSGLVGAFTGWLVIHKAKAILSPANLVPSRTTAALHRALAWTGAKLHLHPNDDNEQSPPSL